jgi:hypothetical protein
VLAGPAIAYPLTLAEIGALEDWHRFCSAKGDSIGPLALVAPAVPRADVGRDHRQCPIDHHLPDLAGYVLAGPAIAYPLTLAEIGALEDWHRFCSAKGLTCPGSSSCSAG